MAFVAPRVMLVVGLSLGCSDTKPSASPVASAGSPGVRTGVPSELGSSGVGGTLEVTTPSQPQGGGGAGQSGAAGQSGTAGQTAGQSGTAGQGGTDASCQGSLFHEGFEGQNDGGWKHESLELGLADPWVRGAAHTPECHDGNSCFSTGLEGEYRNCSEAALVSPIIDLGACPSTASVRVSWWQWISLEGFAEGTYFDSGLVQISRDGGATWAYLPAPALEPAYVGTCGIHDDGCGSALPFLTGHSVWSDQQLASWRLSQFEVPKDYATRAFQVRFVFGSDFKSASRGWLIDDFDVSPK